MAKNAEVTVKELLAKFSDMGERMSPHWDTCHLELCGDGSGSIKYEWANHPFGEPNQIAFNSLDELLAILK